MKAIEIIYKNRSRTTSEKLADSYAMLRVCISRMLRGSKPRFRELLFR